MFPLLPILILLLLGPARADRLAVEGRLPAALLAVHVARVTPARATVVAPVEEVERTAALRSGFGTVVRECTGPPLQRAAVPAVLFPACPPRAGPWVA